MNDTFAVTQFFNNGMYEVVGAGLTAEEAMEKTRRYCSSVGARLGTTVRVIITDDDDCCNFEWKFGEGVTFPTELAGKQFTDEEQE